MTNVVRRFQVSALCVGLAAITSSASADSGRAGSYRNLHRSSIETISSPETIRSLFRSDGSPAVGSTKIWKVLEHGEKVECLSCIPLVAGLLYDTQPKTREIAAWWLRRRIFGVFGPGQVYSQVLAALADTSQTETRRARAAEAIGEFQTYSGARHLARAVREDASPVVREASVRALQRMNHQGPNGELALAMGDADESVRLAAVHAATRVNVFSDVEAVVARIGDESAMVRRAAAAALGTMRVADAVGGLIALSSPETEADPHVRLSAVWSLAQIGDPAARSAIEAAKSDPDRFVRDAASRAAMRL